MTGVRVYRYVGPPELRTATRSDVAGAVIGTHDDVDAWLSGCDVVEAREPFTFVIDLRGTLRLAARRSEHVACAGGEPVLSAGEIAFGEGPNGLEVTEVTNQSTGYCPEASSWPAVAHALDRAGLAHPGRFTDEFVFRRCLRCGERNVVRDGDFTCAICDGELPASWNFDVE